MIQYIRFCADRLVLALGYAKIYSDKNPFDWMSESRARARRRGASPPTHAAAALISVQGKSNFFERVRLHPERSPRRLTRPRTRTRSASATTRARAWARPRTGTGSRSTRTSDPAEPAARAE